MARQQQPLPGFLKLVRQLQQLDPRRLHRPTLLPLAHRFGWSLKGESSPGGSEFDAKPDIRVVVTWGKCIAVELGTWIEGESGVGRDAFDASFRAHQQALTQVLGESTRTGHRPGSSRLYWATWKEPSARLTLEQTLGWDGLDLQVVLRPLPYLPARRARPRPS